VGRVIAVRSTGNRQMTHVNVVMGQETPGRSVRVVRGQETPGRYIRVVKGYVMYARNVTGQEPTAPLTLVPGSVQ
jgi:hypothetical protein